MSRSSTEAVPLPVSKPRKRYIVRPEGQYQIPPEEPKIQPILTEKEKPVLKVIKGGVGIDEFKHGLEEVEDTAKKGHSERQGGGSGVVLRAHRGKTKQWLKGIVR